MADLGTLLGWERLPDEDVGDRYEVMAPVWRKPDGTKVYGAHGWHIPDEAVIKALENPHNDDHLIRFTNEAWIIQHPLAERVDGALFDCEFVWTDGDIGLRGTYVLNFDDEYGEVVLGERVGD